MKVRKGFTLVELLVVIGIIALLISILLPVLGNAKREANRLKCMSNLRQLGLAFQYYLRDYKDKMPAAVNEPGNRNAPIDVERGWYDLIAPYFTKAKIATRADIKLIRDNSVLWGCPEWTIDRQGISATQADSDRRPGYGMSYYTRGAFTLPTTGSFFKEEWDYMGSDSSSASGDYGNYINYGHWLNRSSPSSVGLVTDSMTHVINIPSWGSASAWTTAIEPGGGGSGPFGGGSGGAKNWQPGPAGAVTGGSPSGSLFYVDGLRHAPGGAKKDSRKKYMNMLFMDWHANSVSVREAYTAITGRAVAN